jgi:putative hydrolase of the HAD superfamily
LGEGADVTLPKAMLIDMDDTILAAGERPAVLLQIAQELTAELAPHPPAEVAERLEAALELFWSDPVRHRVARFGVNEARLQVMVETFLDVGSPTLTAELAARFSERFRTVRDEITTCFPGAIEGLQGLRARGVKLTLITNGGADTQRAKIARFGLEPYFDHIQIEGEAGFGKPEERAYRHALAMLGTEPHETWIVGDNLEWEVATPQRLGLTGVWCDGYGRGLPSGTPVRPDRIIRSLSDLLPD